MEPSRGRRHHGKFRMLSMPPRTAGLPIYVDISLHIHSIPEVNVRTMEFSVVLILRQRWHDARVQRNATAALDLDQVPQSRLCKLIWIPDLYFLNARDGTLHQVTQPNEMIWIHADGVIIYSQKLTLRLFCRMTFWNFPMDTQTCSILLGSYGYAKKEVEVRWWTTKHHYATEHHVEPLLEHLAVETNEELGLNVFKNPVYAFPVCNSSTFVTGAFSCLELELRLVRKYGFYIIYAYLPSSLVVLIAWMAFLIDPRAVPARVSLGLLSIIALITHNASLLVHLPNVSYIKAIDLWFFVCLAFVSSTLVESTLANWMNTHAARKKRAQPGKGFLTGLFDGKKQNRVSPEVATTKTAPQQVEMPVQSGELEEDDGKVRFMDKFCLGAYPICFIVFNIIYWPFYSGES
ncbi:unnamed protein product [Dibothriocephalus latus]|uniref:Neurotransmitter-gated ion-channel ligand-binding domain-containing protein n=1 Tax=Dibothriocephalus latus TaxID=60516 RepID=A0A3P7L1T5_DIBLA|nr:unnamed protein product [Dibothriocephalus latus]